MFIYLFAFLSFQQDSRKQLSFYNLSSMTSAIAFSEVVPVRLIGISSSIPFCSVVSDGKILYSSGAHLILENTHTNEQKIVYTHSGFGQVQFVVHHITLYNEHLLAIVIRDGSTLLRAVSIIPLNTSILSLQRNQEEPRVVYLKHIEDYEQVESLQFFQQGMFMGVVSINQHLTTFCLLRIANAEPIFKETFLYTHVLMSSTTLSKQNYICLLLFDKREETRLCLLAADELSRRLYFTLSLEGTERILQYCFQPGHQESVLLVALTTYGNVLLYKVNEYEALLQTKINAKMPAHQQKMLITSTQHLLPSQMQVSGNKIVLAYHQSKTIQLIQYSTFNPSSYSSVTLTEALEPYPQIHSTHSIRISKDGCSLAGLFRVHPHSISKQLARTTSCTMKVLPESGLSAAEQLTQKEIGEAHTNKQLGYFEKEQFLALQIDLLSNIIDHNQKKLSIGRTLSICAGQAPITKVEYCPQNNTMFLLLGNQTIKYYDLTPNPNLRGKPEFRPGSLLLWIHELSEQPLTVAAHPLNFTILFLYRDILKLHNYNCKSLLPAYVVSPIQNTRHAAYSPLGDKIILATGSCLTVIDAYTFRTVNVIGLPNIQLQSLVSSEHPYVQPKSINKLLFLTNEKVLVLSGQNTLSVVEGLQRSVHFGFIEQEKNTKKQIVFDSVNQLAVVAEADVVLVLSRATFNSNSKCEVVSKIQITASSLLAAPEIGVCFVGSDSGSLYLLQWPNYSPEDLYIHQSHHIRLFDEPVIAIHSNPSMQYLYAVSANGALAICELKVSEGQNIPAKYKQHLLKLADIPLRRNERWLISRSDQERKERELIKLRGEEADTANHHSHLDKEQSLLQQNLILNKRGQLESIYLTQIKTYQEKLGLQKITQEISLLKDQLKLMRRRRQREMAEIAKNNSEDLFKLFQERRKLQFQLANQSEVLSTQRGKLREQLQNQIAFLVEDFHSQNKAIQEKHQEAYLDADKSSELLKIKQGLTTAQFSQRLELMRAQFEIEKEKLMEIGQTILSKNRNTHVASFCLQDKINDLNTEKEKVQFDLIKISNEKESLQRMQSELSISLEATNTNYNRLIKQTRELEEQLLNERRVAVKLHGDLNQIKNELTELEQRGNELDLSYLKLSDDFIGQRQQLQSSEASLKDLTAKLEALKTIKKDKEYRRSLAKARLEQAVSTLARELAANSQNTVQKLKDRVAQNQQLLHQSQLSTEFEERKANLDKMARDAIKWKTLKNTYMGGFRRSSHKLNDENLKLTYQYNDLFKVSQDYRTTITDLQERIEVVKRQIQYSKALAKWNKEFQLKKQVQSRENIRCSLFGKPRDFNVRKKGLLVKKGVCVSLHQESGKFITQA